MWAHLDAKKEKTCVGITWQVYFILTCIALVFWIAFDIFLWNGGAFWIFLWMAEEAGCLMVAALMVKRCGSQDESASNVWFWSLTFSLIARVTVGCLWGWLWPNPSFNNFFGWISEAGIVVAMTWYQMVLHKVHVHEKGDITNQPK